jgi:23S rRNA-/tRNA-specific pseudouridylate synthase
MLVYMCDQYTSPQPTVVVESSACACDFDSFYKQTQIIGIFRHHASSTLLTPVRQLMMSRKVSSVEALGRAARSLVSATTTRRTEMGSRGPAVCPPGVLYVDRGVIVLNKPPGLVSQATAPSHRNTSGSGENRAISGKNVHHPPASTFDDVLNGRSTYHPGAVQGKGMISFAPRATELQRRYDLSTNPYPVHRLDKVRAGEGGGKGWVAELTS